MPTSANTGAAAGRLEWRNNMALAGWIFMAIWTGMLGLFTWLFIRDGGFNQFSPPLEAGIMGLFWLFGIGGCRFFFAMPRVQVAIVQNQVVVRQRWAWRSQVERFPLRKLSPPVLAEEKDSDGDPYFRTSIVTPAGRSIVVAEGNNRDAVQEAHDRLLAAMR